MSTPTVHPVVEGGTVAQAPAGRECANGTPARPARDNPRMSPQLPHDVPLGRSVDYPRHYDAGLLFPIPRAAGRAALGIDAGALPFTGHDRWHAYELSWLDARGSRRRPSPCRRIRRSWSSPSR